MKTYKTLLFDVDDTLLDFSAAEHEALAALFSKYNIPFTDEIKADYKTINQGLWHKYEEGVISREEVVNTRFSLLFRQYGQDVNGEELELLYRGYLETGNFLIRGAYNLIRDLHTRFDLYVVTNGVSSTQYKRLKQAGLLPFFQDIFVSEDSGYQKPMKAFFDHVFSKIPHFDAKQALIIGDSLHADIKGGYQAGIDTCWINPARKPNHIDIVPSYEIESLAELYEILGVSQ